MAGELGSSERSLGKELGQLPEGSVQAKLLKPHDQNCVQLVRASGAGSGRLLPRAWGGHKQDLGLWRDRSRCTVHRAWQLLVWVGITAHKWLFSFCLNSSRDGRVTADKEFGFFPAGE